MKQAFVTGGSGFVGRNLVARLGKEGIRTYALSRSSTSDKILTDLGATPVRGDLHDKEALRRGMIGADTVFHLAASVDFWKPASALWHDHVDGTKNVIDIATENHVKSLVYLGASSVIMNGKPIVGVNEDFRSDNIIDGYSRTKLAAEENVLRSNSKTLRTISIRPPLIWGRGDTSVLPRMKHAAETGRLRFINGGTHEFVTCNVSNVVEVLMLAGNSEIGGRAYFVTDGERLQFKKFIKELMHTQGIEVKERTVPLRVARLFASLMSFVWTTFRLKDAPPMYPGMINTIGLPFVISDQRARAELGYSPVVSVKQGLEEMMS